MKNWSLATFEDVRPGNVVEYEGRTDVVTKVYVRDDRTRGQLTVLDCQDGSPIEAHASSVIEVYR